MVSHLKLLNQNNHFNLKKDYRFNLLSSNLDKMTILVQKLTYSVFDESKLE